ncbi:unnamed protein product [Gongylonema pulchrum]|uniref:TRPM tetramerisation domain-containing protein n=1 Tax=Gongylonema pulchrum TaxID=637853 RepID=A0A3P6PKA0_9BILA|nr:unnamed protein product [Gongylonema pulchrum]
MFIKTRLFRVIFNLISFFLLSCLANTPFNFLGNSLCDMQNFLDIAELFLNADEVEKIHDFEEECMEDLAREKEYKKNTSTEERIHRTAERSPILSWLILILHFRTDLVLLRLNDLASKDSALKSLARDFDRRLEVLENRQRETLDYVRQLASTLGKVSPSSSGYGFSPVPQSVGSADDRTQASPSSALGGTDTAQLQRPGFLPRPDPLEAAASLGKYYLSPTKGEKDFSFAGRARPIKRRTRTTTVTGCIEIHPEPQTSPEKSSSNRFGSLLSLDPAILNRGSDSNILKKKSPCITESVRRARRHEEYTSITDAIDLSHHDTVCITFYYFT